MSDEPMPEVGREGLWPDDTGTLAEVSRRALVRLLQGPYLSGRAHPQLWAGLIADEAAIRSRLHDVFLDLVIDPIEEFAFTRKVRDPQIDAPQTLRSERLTFADTAMLLVLRQILLAARGETRVIVGQDEVYERLEVYRTGDEATYQRNLNSAWQRMKNRFRVVHDVGDERVEISPVVRFLIDEDQVQALTEVYERVASRAGAAVGDEDERAAESDEPQVEAGVDEEDA